MDRSAKASIAAFERILVAIILSDINPEELPGVISAFIADIMSEDDNEHWSISSFVAALHKICANEGIDDLDIPLPLPDHDIGHGISRAKLESLAFLPHIRGHHDDNQLHFASRCFDLFYNMIRELANLPYRPFILVLADEELIELPDILESTESKLRSEDDQTKESDDGASDGTPVETKEQHKDMARYHPAELFQDAAQALYWFQVEKNRKEKYKDKVAAELAGSRKLITLMRCKMLYLRDRIKLHEGRELHLRGNLKRTTMALSTSRYNNLGLARKLSSMQQREQERKEFLGKTSHSE